MSDAPDPQQNITSEYSLTSETYVEVLDVVERLYIRGNMSARVHLIRDWPVLADYILGAALIVCDSEGTDDLEHKATLEMQAQERHFLFVQTLRTVQSDSAQDGVLNFEYLENLAQLWGQDLFILIFAPRVVDKVFKDAPRAPQVARHPENISDPKIVPVQLEPDSQDIYAPNPQKIEKAVGVLPTPKDMKFSEKLVGPDMPKKSKLNLKAINIAPIQTDKPKDDGEKEN